MFRLFTRLPDWKQKTARLETIYLEWRPFFREVSNGVGADRVRVRCHFFFVYVICSWTKDKGRKTMKQKTIERRPATPSTPTPLRTSQCLSEPEECSFAFLCRVCHSSEEQSPVSQRGTKGCRLTVHATRKTILEFLAVKYVLQARRQNREQEIASNHLQY